MVGLYQNGNNQIPDTTSQDIQMPAPLMDSFGRNGNNVSNSQYATLDEFPLAQSASEYCNGDQTTSLHPDDYAYQQSACFRTFETDIFCTDNNTCYSTISPVGAAQPGRLGELFKSVTFPSPTKESQSCRLLSHNVTCEQDILQKSLPPLSFNPIYPSLCLSTPQRLHFDATPQHHHQEEGLLMQANQQQQDLQISTFQSPNKLRSPNGLMGLLGNKTQKLTGAPLSAKTNELKAIKREENVLDSAVPRSSYMCRKCRAHGRLIAVRQHKRNCPYKHCNCSVCSLVNYGRHIVARQIALYRDQKNHHAEDGNTSTRTRGDGGIRPRSGTGKEKADPEEEGPHCRRCRNHGKTNPWKGHKKVCPFYYCICQQCILITLRKSNEKNLREVVQESTKEVGLKAPRKHTTDEITFPVPFYNKKFSKSGQEKQAFIDDQEQPSGYPVGYGLRWSAGRNHEEDCTQPSLTLPGNETWVLPPGAITNAQQENTFYNSRAHQAAAFAAAAAAAVAFQQETEVSSVDAAVQLKEESRANCCGQLIGRSDYSLADTWVCGGEIKCVVSPKDVNTASLEGFAGQNGFGGLWQSQFQSVRNDDPVHIDGITLASCQQPVGHFPETNRPTVDESRGQMLSHKVDNPI